MWAEWPSGVLFNMLIFLVLVACIPNVSARPRRVICRLRAHPGRGRTGLACCRIGEGGLQLIQLFASANKAHERQSKQLPRFREREISGRAAVGRTEGCRRSLLARAPFRNMGDPHSQHGEVSPMRRRGDCETMGRSHTHEYREGPNVIHAREHHQLHPSGTAPRSRDRTSQRTVASSEPATPPCPVAFEARRSEHTVVACVDSSTCCLTIRVLPFRQDSRSQIVHPGVDRRISVGVTGVRSGHGPA